MALVLFFDGECGFCSRSVRQVHRLDKAGAVDFAPLQGEFSKKLGFGKHAEKEAGTMVVLRESDGQKFFRSDAWIELGRALGGIWKLLADGFSLFPKAARDRVYDVIARNRHRLGGETSCGLPGAGLRARMRE